MTLDTASTAKRIRSRIDDVVEREALAGLMLGLRVRRFAFAGVAALVALLAPFPDSLYYFVLIGLFIGTGEVLLWRLRAGRISPWVGYCFIAGDMALLAFTLLYPNPIAAEPYPSSLSMKFGSFVYLFVLLAQLAFAFRPRFVLWGGVIGALVWIVGVSIILAQPGYQIGPLRDETNFDEALRQLADPYVIDIGIRVQEVGTFLIVAGVLAVVVQRSRRLVLRAATAERARGNLARYFPPAMVDRLATRDTPLSAPREANAAILFVDVVGFTHWAEVRSPNEVIDALRTLHARLETLIFEHGGTLDKFTGDGVMATFGTPDPAPDDAARAVACVRAILSAFPPDAPLRLALGLHWGPIIVGDVGSERRMEFAVLGDAVNVASRLERLARELHARAVLSDAVVSRSGDSGIEMVSYRAVELRGREQSIDVWTL